MCEILHEWGLSLLHSVGPILGVGCSSVECPYFVFICNIATTVSFLHGNFYHY